MFIESKLSPLQRQDAEKRRYWIEVEHLRGDVFRACIFERGHNFDLNSAVLLGKHRATKRCAQTSGLPELTLLKVFEVYPPKTIISSKETSL